MTPTLIASMNGEPVGILRDEAGYWTFEYDPAWRLNGFPISPAFPLSARKITDTSTSRHVAWFFDNLLPEEAAREVLAKDARVTIDDAWGLLAYFGAESAGAIALLPEGAEVPPADLVALSDETLQRRIDQMPRRSLSADAPKRMSLAGAQHKLAVTVEAGALFEPTGAACSTHILKPDSKSDEYPHTAVNEYFCMRLAEALKLTVPAATLRRVPWPVYQVERFDRVPLRAPLERSHTLDALQLLSLDRKLKYQKASPATLKACVDLCGAPLKTKHDLFAWAVFNVLIGNADAHLKNVSFFLDSSGIRLAPFYDMVSTVVYATPQHDKDGPHWPNVRLSMPLGRATLFSEVTRGDLLQVADELELRAKTATRILDELVGNIARASADLLQASLVTAKPEEACLLQLIRQLPITDMANQLT